MVGLTIHQGEPMPTIRPLTRASASTALGFGASARPRLLMAAVLALALLGGASQVWAQGPGHGGGHRMGGMDEARAPHMMGRQLDAVGATAEQKAQIQTIMAAARTDLAPQREQQRALRQQMATLMTATVIDARAVEALRQQMVALHDSSSKRRVQALVDAGAVLTPAQRQQLAERMAKRQELAKRHMDERRALDGAKR